MKTIENVIEEMETFTRAQTTEMLVATLAKIEVTAAIKTLRCGMQVKDFSREVRISRRLICSIIEEREGGAMIDALMESFDLEVAN